MITTIRRGEVYQFSTMDPAVLDEVRDIEWANEQSERIESEPTGLAEQGLVDAFRRLFSRRRPN